MNASFELATFEIVLLTILKILAVKFSDLLKLNLD